MNPVRPAHRPRGSASTVVAALLALALLVATGWSQRHVIAEQAMAARQQQAQQAAAAAEAGVAWTLARLADPRPAGADCTPAATGPSFRDLLGAGTTDVAACVADGNGWRCRCAVPGAGAPELPEGAAGFRVAVQAGATPGPLQITATGCAGRLDACDAVARAGATAAWLPPLAQQPAAALAVRGRLDAGSAPVGFHHADPASGGIAVHTGGPLNAAAARLTAPAGSLRADSVVSNDASFTALADPAAALLGIDRLGFAARATPFTCRPGDCTAPLLELLETSRAQAVSVGSDLRIAGPAEIGSAARPVLLVVDGDVTIDGDVALHGMLVTRDLTWNGGTGPTARVHGGVLVTGNATLAATSVDFIHDARLLARLQAQAALPVPVPGRWRDF